MAGTLIVSLDFELFWGMLDVCPLEKYQDHVLGGRKAIPGLLALFQKYGIHATWATVGFLFARSAQEAASFFPEEGLRPAYDDPALNSYAEFSKIGETEADAPCFFAPSLVELVAETPGQEIGSHTFSHYYCKEKGQTAEQFAADMTAAKAIAAKYGYTLTSAVLPGTSATRHTSGCCGTWASPPTGEWKTTGWKIRFTSIFPCGYCG